MERTGATKAAAPKWLGTSGSVLHMIATTGFGKSQKRGIADCLYHLRHEVSGAKPISIGMARSRLRR